MDIGEKGYRRYLNGEDDGLTVIIQEYKDGLILYINKYVNNIYVAEDLTQETFFKIAVKKPKFNGCSSFKTWLYAMGRNLAIDYLRHNSKRATLSVEEMTTYIKDETDLENLYINSERKMLIHKAITTLKVEYQQVLWLVYFESFSNDEVAKIMNKSKKQIGNLIFRAKQSLKSVLDKGELAYEEL